MADFHEEFAVLVKSLSGVAAVVDDRVYPDALKQGCRLPAIVYFESGGETIEHLTDAAGLCSATYHTYSYGATRTAANELDELLRVGLQSYSGTPSSTHITEIHCFEHRDTGWEYEDDGSDQKRYWTRRTYAVWHAETV